MGLWRNARTLAVVATAIAAAVVGPAAKAARAEETLQVGLVGGPAQDPPGESSRQSTAGFSGLPLGRLLEDLTGLPARVVPPLDHDELGRLLTVGKAHLGLFHGVEFAWARQKYPGLRPLLVLVNERPYLRACLVVRRDAEVKDFAGLKGRSCALPHGCHQHCRLFLEARCKQFGAEPRRFFAQLVRPACVDDAIEGVVDGEFTATVVDEVAVDCFRQQKPGRFARLRVLERSATFPAVVIAYAEGALGQATLDLVHHSLLRAARSPRARAFLTLSRMTGFEEVPDDYERTLREVAVVYRPPARTGLLERLLAGTSSLIPASRKTGKSTGGTANPGGP